MNSYMLPQGARSAAIPRNTTPVMCVSAATTVIASPTRPNASVRGLGAGRSGSGAATGSPFPWPPAPTAASSRSGTFAVRTLAHSAACIVIASR